MREGAKVETKFFASIQFNTLTVSADEGGSRSYFTSFVSLLYMCIIGTVVSSVSISAL